MDKTATVIHRVFALLSFKQIALYILLLLCGLNANAQATYPVQVYTQLTPPYTSYLPAYYSGINQKLKVTLINTDMQQPSVSVYLRMQIKSSAFTIQTPENVYTDRIELQAGVPLQLSLDDLAVYFKSENMRISGARNEFLRTQMLPDNFYRFNFEVYESNTHRLLSNPRLGFAQAMIASGEPPILNLPFKGTAIAEQNIPSIMFSWTPRHMNSVASAYGTEYEITLVEIFDKQVAPEAAFDYSRPIYTETTRATSFIHTAAQPMLIPGMRYAWRVRAVAREGVEEANVFKNNGYSPISWFDYTVDCKQVEQSAVVIEGRVATVTWTKTDAVDYEVQYRKKGSNRWYTGTILNSACPIYNLKFGEKYEYRIGVRCTMNDAFIYTDVKGFVMPEELAYSKNCGILPDINLTNQTPTRELQAKLPILVGDFPVFITKVSGSGRFTGEGYVGIPYLKNAKIAVTFKDIVVNTDNRLVSGFIETKYDINKNMIFDGDEFLTGGKGVGDVRTGEERAAYEVSFNIDASKPATVKPFDDKSEDDIRAAEDYITSKGENPQYIITVIDENGDPQKIGVGEMPTTIKDGADKIYEVDKDGNIKQVSSKSDIVLDDRSKNIQDTTYVSSVTFEKTNGTKYALDQYKTIYEKVKEYDREYEVNETDIIRASAKLMLPGTTDEIFVRITNPKEKFDAQKVSFIAENKTKYDAKFNGTDGWNLTIVAPEANDGQLIYVVHEHEQDGENGKEIVQRTMAILKVLTYEPLKRSVTLVPVNEHKANFKAEEVEKELNRIYGKIGIEWTVNMLDSIFSYTPINESTFNVTGSGLLSTETDDMEAINKAFKESGYYQEDGLYLFILGYQASDKGEVEGTGGAMPLKSQFGYLFQGADGRTIAHELGHGAFNLEHPFSRPGRNSFKNKGDLEYNLMDYPTIGNYDKATEFAKLQWDQTRKPGNIFGIFQKDKDGKSDRVKNVLELLSWIKDNLGKENIEYKKDRFYESYSIFEEPIKVEGLDITVFVELGDDGILNLGKTTKDTYTKSKIGVHFDLRGKYHNGFYLSFKYASGDKDAIKIWTYSYDHFNQLLHYFDLKLTEPKVTELIESYQVAIKSAGDNCNKLDVIYETIPDFVMNEISDEKLYSHLEILGKCSIGNHNFNKLWWQDTDEEKAILNIIKGLDGKWFYNKVNSSPEVFEKILFKIGANSKHTEEISKIIYAKVAPQWEEGHLTANDYVLFGTKDIVIDPSANYYTETNIPLSYRFVNLSVSSSHIYSDAANSLDVVDSEDRYLLNKLGLSNHPSLQLLFEKQTITIGGCWDMTVGKYIFGNEIITLLPTPLNCTQHIKKRAFDPIVVVSDDGQETIMPALIVKLYFEDKGMSYGMQFLNLSLSVTLPEVFIKPLTLTKWSKFFKVKGGKVTDNVVFEFKNSLIARIEQEGNMTLKYSDAELQQIISKGKALDIPKLEIEDIIFNGCRNSKNFNIDDLAEQLAVWSKVRTDGFPVLFSSLEEYQEFSSVIKNLAKEWDLPTNSIYVQGSSLRMKNVADIGDIDIAIKVDAATFDKLVSRFTEATTSTGRAKNIISDAAKGKITGGSMFSEGKAKSFKGELMNTLEVKSQMKFLDKYKVSDLQISIIKEGSKIDVSPYMLIK